jgi:preprotein translocase subunit YajC
MESMLLPVLMIGALGVMMFFSVRKQKRQVAETKSMQESVQPGARVMTTSGLHGTVTAVADDTIELEVAPGMRTTWVRAAVREVVVPSPVSDLDGALTETSSDGSLGSETPRPAAPLDFTKDPARRDPTNN